MRSSGSVHWQFWQKVNTPTHQSTMRTVKRTTLQSPPSPAHFRPRFFRGPITVTCLGITGGSWGTLGKSWTFTTAIFGIPYLRFHFTTSWTANTFATFVVKLQTFRADFLILAGVADTLAFFWVPLESDWTGMLNRFTLTPTVFFRVDLRSIVTLRWFHSARASAFCMVRHREKSYVRLELIWILWTRRPSHFGG